MKIVLASGSPRRRELFRLITEDFEIRVTNCDETIPGKHIGGKRRRIPFR